MPERRGARGQHSIRKDWPSLRLYEFETPAGLEPASPSVPVLFVEKRVAGKIRGGLKRRPECYEHSRRQHRSGDALEQMPSLRPWPGFLRGAIADHRHVCFMCAELDEAGELTSTATSMAGLNSEIASALGISQDPPKNGSVLTRTIPPPAPALYLGQSAVDGVEALRELRKQFLSRRSSTRHFGGAGQTAAGRPEPPNHVSDD